MPSDNPASPIITANGFREYDARWLYPKEINLVGVSGAWAGAWHLFPRIGIKPRVVVGHDYRSYSLSNQAGADASA